MNISRDHPYSLKQLEGYWKMDMTSMVLKRFNNTTGGLTGRLCYVDLSYSSLCHMAVLHCDHAICCSSQHSVFHPSLHCCTAKWKPTLPLISLTKCIDRWLYGLSGSVKAQVKVPILEPGVHIRKLIWTHYSVISFIVLVMRQYYDNIETLAVYKAPLQNNWRLYVWSRLFSAAWFALFAVSVQLIVSALHPPVLQTHYHDASERHRSIIITHWV